MPLIAHSGYRAPFHLLNGHVQTIWNAFRRAPAIAYRRERIETPDGDFLDLDWAGEDLARPLVIVCYGMESDARSPYIRGIVAALLAAGFAAVVWNYRGCSGEPNRKIHFYHGGLVEDLHTVVLHAIARGWTDLRLAGFSLGGNLLLNYLGRRGDAVPAEVRCGAAFSSPTDVADCARHLKRGMNRFYERLFLRSFREKIRAKMKHHPGRLDDDGYDRLASLEDYDERYTVPHFGFENVPVFYRAVSSRFVLDGIRRPTLLVTALDDPFMGPVCIPFEEAKLSAFLHLETPAHGGHLGFLERGGSWMERRLVDWLREAIQQA